MVFCVCGFCACSQKRLRKRDIITTVLVAIMQSVPHFQVLSRRWYGEGTLTSHFRESTPALLSTLHLGAPGS